MTPTTTPYPSILTSSATNLRAALMRSSTLSEMAKARLTAKLSLELGRKQHDAFLSDFEPHAHPPQRAPRLANSGADWTTWLILGGRGAGKTRAGAQWVRDIALNDKHARIALIGETEHEVRSVMVEGVSGLLAVHRPRERPQWTPTTKRIEWSSGAVAEVFSAENYE